MKLDVNVLRYLSKDEFRVLTATEMGMKNHEIVPTELIERIAGLKHGGAYKNVKTLLRHKLVHHDASKYDGYRLTNLGYDFLAIKTLVNRGVISGLGRQIGVGKESDIFEVVTEDGKTLALKLHRLGRTSFRAVKSKRDYLKHRNSFNWLYLSRLAALKEYAFMKALGEHGFPVPEAVDWNRHCVLMTLVPGFPLVQVKELQNPGTVFQYIMSLIVRLAQHGLIHCDFNEFNIMIDENEKVTMIDFPQMVSVLHHNAEMYFQRDAECIFTFFNKQYHYDPLRESNGGEMLDGLLSDWELDEDGRPDFNAIARDSESLDKELAASGFTHQNQKDLEKYGFGIDDGETSSEDDEGDKCDEIVDSNQDIQPLDSSRLVDGHIISCDVIENNISRDSIENAQRNLEPECPVLAHEDDDQSLHEKKDEEEHSSSGDEEDIQQSKRIEKQRKHAAASVRVGSRYYSSRNANKDKGGRRSRFHVNSDF